MALQHKHIESMVLETNEGELGVLKSEEENDLEQYETDEEEFDPGSSSNRLTNMHQVTLGQSNWSPGNTLLIITECPQVQDEHPWLKTTHEEEDETGDGAVESMSSMRLTKRSLRGIANLSYCRGEQTGTYPGSPCTRSWDSEKQKEEVDEGEGDRDMKKFKGILNNKKDRPTLKSKVDLLEYDTSTNRSIGTDEMIIRWPLPRLSPSHYTENNLTLGGEMNIMTQFMDNKTNNLQETMKLVPDLAAVGVSDYVWGMEMKATVP